MQRQTVIFLIIPHLDISYTWINRHYSLDHENPIYSGKSRSRFLFYGASSWHWVHPDRPLLVTRVVTPHWPLLYTVMCCNLAVSQRRAFLHKQKTPWGQKRWLTFLLHASWQDGICWAPGDCWVSTYCMGNYNRLHQGVGWLGRWYLIDKKLRYFLLEVMAYFDSLFMWPQKSLWEPQ